MNLTETKDGTVVEVFVKPNQREFKILLEGEDIIVSAKEEPTKNRVNKEIIKELSKLFHASVKLASGATSRKKKFIIEDLTKAETERSIWESSG